jgi:hypothetical protein
LLHLVCCSIIRVTHGNLNRQQRASADTMENGRAEKGNWQTSGVTLTPVSPFST